MESEKAPDNIDNSGKIKQNNVGFFIGLIIAGAIFILLYMVVTGNTNQIYRDIVTGETALDASNKSAERNLVYLLSIAGSVAYFFYFIFSKRKDMEISPKSAVTRSGSGLASQMILMLLVFTGVHYLMFLGANELLTVSVLYAFLLYIVDKTLLAPGLGFLWFGTYAVSAIYRIYVAVGVEKPLSMMSNVLIALVISIVILLGDNKRMRLHRGILVCQLIIPFLLLIYTAHKYKNGEEMVSIYIPRKALCLIIVFIVCFIGEAAVLLYRYWRECGNIKNAGTIISFGSCVSIMAFNRFSGTGAIFSNNLHHTFENVISWSQMVELGQAPFSEYIPVAGMYSLLQGFFFAFFGNGEAGYYNLSENIFYLFIILLIVALLKIQFTGEWVFIISLILNVMSYNRIVLILPMLLFLSWPKLVGKKNLWLKVWFLTSFLHGLYYPVFGAAVCLGFLPLGLYQIVTFVKSGELMAEIRKISFWIWWIVCCIPVVLGVPYLMGTVRHMLAMGGQTVYADGISKFGQMMQGNFLRYINSSVIKLSVYYVFSFIIVAGVVWMSVALCLEIGNVRIADRRIRMDNAVPAFSVLAGGITMLVSLSYTIIRSDIGDIYARSAGVVYAVTAMFLVMISKYLKESKLKYFALAFSVFAVAVVSAEGFFDNAFKLTAYYTVPEEYVYVENDPIERFGTCFVPQSTYDNIEENYAYAEMLDKEKSYLGICNDFGYFYLFGLKGDSVIERGTIRGFGAAEETVDLIQKNGTIVGAVSVPIDNYYLYHWLMTSGKYIWSSEYNYFEPNHGELEREEVLLQHKNLDTPGEGYALKRIAGSWGLSMDSLSDIFTKPDLEASVSSDGNSATVTFNNLVDGDDADFMYLEFADMDQNYEYILFDHVEDQVQEEDFLSNLLMKKDYNRGMTVIVSWSDDNGEWHSMNCLMGQGKLLVPLGAGRKWLLHGHDSLRISVQQNGEAVPLPEILKVDMLKLREVE